MKTNSPIDNFFETILETIQPAYLWSKDGDLHLTETHGSAKCRSFMIKNPGPHLAYKFDRTANDEDGNSIMEPLIILRKKPPLRSKCDYILFVKHENYKGQQKLYVVICNMKSEVDGNVEDQFKAGHDLAMFILKRAYNSHSFWNSNAQKEVKELPAGFIDNLVVFRELYIRSRVSKRKKGTNPGKASVAHKSSSSIMRKEKECGIEIHGFGEILSKA